MTVKKQRFYQVTVNEAERVADINIYGDITSWEWFDSDVSAHSIKTEIDALDVDTINVYINSYGGEVAEALAIYSVLKRHSASVHTFCDGFACSAATIIFCAGDVRTMGAISLMMIHNAMTYGFGNAEELRKAADDIEKITQSSVEAYKMVSNLSEEEIKEMMDKETWLTAEEALEYGFATDIADQEEDDDTAQQSAFHLIREAILKDQWQIDLSPIMQKLAKLQESIDALQKEEDPEPVKPVNVYRNNFMKMLGGK